MVTMTDALEMRNLFRCPGMDVALSLMENGC